MRLAARALKVAFQSETPANAPPPLKRPPLALTLPRLMIAGGVGDYAPDFVHVDRGRSRRWTRDA